MKDMMSNGFQTALNLKSPQLKMSLRKLSASPQSVGNDNPVLQNCPFQNGFIAKNSVSYDIRKLKIRKILIKKQSLSQKI
jgi:hypothetical protein